MGFWEVLDYRIFASLNSWAGIYRGFDMVIIAIAQYALWIAIPALIIWSLIKPYRWKVLLTGIMSWVLARLIITEFIRSFINRDRPFLTHTVVQLVPKVAAASFPSGHTIAGVVIGAAIYWYDKRVGAAMIVLGLFVGLARIIAGVHYPGDVLAGAVIGILSGWVVGKFLKPKLEMFFKD